jgi:DNA-binding response OmpR family regulator
LGWSVQCLRGDSLRSHKKIYELLLVDDDPTIRKIVTYIFSANGFVVTSASNTAAAMQMMEEKKFHLLVSDLNIDEDHDGLSVIAAMRRTQPSALTFILTATPDAKSTLWAIRNDVDGYFKKSADLRAVARQVSERMSGRRDGGLAAA